MSCKHGSVRFASVEIKGSPEPGAVVVEFAGMECKECGEALSAAEDRIYRGADGASFQVKLAQRASAFDVTNLRCGKCRRRLFGQDEDGVGLAGRGEVLDIECGPVHTIRYESGLALRAADGRLWKE